MKLDDDDIIAVNLINSMFTLQEEVREKLINKGCTHITRIYTSYLPDENTLVKLGVGYVDENQNYIEEDYETKSEVKLTTVFGEGGKVYKPHKLSQNPIRWGRK